MRLAPINKIVIHHSTGGSWENIKSWHKLRGWGENSAYHYFLTKQGELKNGRPLNQPAAATPSWKANHSGIHVCVSGNFENEEPTQEQLNIIKRMKKDLRFKVIGHKDVSATRCPGKFLYNKLPEINQPPVSDWAKKAVEKAITNKIATQWDDPQRIVGTPELAHILKNCGIITKVDPKGISKEQIITGFYNKGLLDK